MLEVKLFLEKQSGLLLLRFVKREYHIDMEQIREGLPPPKITRIVKCVKYMLYWNSIEKCLVVPHDKYLGEGLFSWNQHTITSSQV